MFYRTCTGCVLQGRPCTPRNEFRKAVEGLMIRSVLWHCRAKEPRFVAGDPVWAHTVESQSHNNDDGGPYRDDFPAVVIRPVGPKMLVYIEPNSPGRSFGDDVHFDASSNGFCKIPLSRLKLRDGERQEICRFCDWPASLGHQEGYSCNPSR